MVFFQFDVGIKNLFFSHTCKLFVDPSTVMVPSVVCKAFGGIVAEPMTVPLAVTIWAVCVDEICAGCAGAVAAVATCTTCHFVGSLGSC